MRTCRKCGARLSPDVDWCLRCYRPALRHSAAEAHRPEFPDDVRYVPAAPPERAVVVPEARIGTTIARLGPATIGLALNLLVTALMVAIGLGVRALAFVWTDTLGSIALAFTAILLGVWAIVAAPVLWSAWRPQRPYVLRVEGEVLSVTPARRRADDLRVPAR